VTRPSLPRSCWCFRAGGLPHAGTPRLPLHGHFNMVPPTAVFIPCLFCCLSFRHMPNLARHVQTSHRNESRCVAAAVASAAMSQSFVRGPLADMAHVQGPALLNMNAGIDAGAATDGVAVTGAAPMDVNTSEGSPAGVWADAPPEGRNLDGAAESGVLFAGGCDTDEEQESSAAADGNDAISTADVDLLAALPRHVFWSSTASRIRAYYLAFRETLQSKPVVPLRWASHTSLFCTPALRGALRCSLTAGGCGPTERDHMA